MSRRTSRWRHARRERLRALPSTQALIVHLPFMDGKAGCHLTVR